MKETLTVIENVPVFHFLFSILRKVNRSHIAGLLVFLVFFSVFFFTIPTEVAGNDQTDSWQQAQYKEDQQSLLDPILGLIKGPVKEALTDTVSFLCIFILELLTLILVLAGNLFDYTVDFTITNLTTNLEALDDGI
ncbi:MAG: hypothetical protein ACQEP6_02260, partial [Patescibacteria group bacterium]